MNDAINSRLAVITSYYAEVDALIALQLRIIDTYEGMLSHANNAEGCDAVIECLGRNEAELATLREDRAELDRMWNEAILSTEAA